MYVIIYGQGYSYWRLTISIVVNYIQNPKCCNYLKCSTAVQFRIDRFLTTDTNIQSTGSIYSLDSHYRIRRTEKLGFMLAIRGRKDSEFNRDQSIYLTYFIWVYEKKDTAVLIASYTHFHYFTNQSWRFAATYVMVSLIVKCYSCLDITEWFKS